MKDKKILMILNEFPPTGQSGVQRGLKFLKYTCRAGWEAHVITPKNPVRKVVDYSLLSDIPPEAHIHRVTGFGLNTVTESKMVHARFQIAAPQRQAEKIFWAFVKLINDLLFPYDKQIGWMPFALVKAIKLINKHKIRNVYITAFPYSVFWVGLALKLIYGNRIFWVADYRDAWQFAPLLDKYVLPFRLKIITKTDDLVLKRCDVALFVTKNIQELYIQKHPWLKYKSATITNGYDEDDFVKLHSTLFDCFTFMYMGKIHVSYGNPLPLLNAISQSNLPKFQFIHIGSVDKTVQDSISKAGIDWYKFEGYKPHLEALNYSSGADINIIMLSDDPESEHSYSGKLFELLRLGKPILAVGPKNSIIKRVLDQTQGGRYAHVSDIDQIVSCINELLTLPQNRPIPLQILHHYSREHLTKSLLDLYN